MDLMRLSVILLVVGGLNWGSVGLTGKDLVVAALGRGTAAKAVYVAVGLAAVFVGLRLFGFMEGFENNNMANGNNMAGNMMTNGNMPNGNNRNMAEGFYACKDGKDEAGKPCHA